MKKLINTAIFYGIFALVSGVFYREITKITDFYGGTNLSLLHTHLFVMGMFFFLILTVIEKNFQISKHKRFSLFCWLYNGGLMLSIFMLLIRGFIQMNETLLNKGMDAAMAGISGIGHIILNIGLMGLLFIVRKQIISQTDAQ